MIILQVTKYVDIPVNDVLGNPSPPMQSVSNRLVTQKWKNFPKDGHLGLVKHKAGRGLIIDTKPSFSSVLKVG